jgi:putative hydrolase of the HAD superfamily
MGEPRALFWDIGGVLLTNGWDTASRRGAAAEFHLEWEDFESRHQLVVNAFELGQLTLDDYLERTVFFQPRTFTKDAFVDFMRAQSQAYHESLAVLERLAQSRRYLLATLNNESLELNQYRITRFGLKQYFPLFISSCFLGLRKPDAAIYRLALQLTQLPPEDAVFIDDRALNLECAQRVGMRTIQYQNAAQLQHALRDHHVEA